MSAAGGLVVVPGDSPLVLVAPHGGRRDAVRRPWAAGRLRMNDLHTATLTEELAGLLGAAAVINDAHDRNDVDLNRIVEAHERAPWFLERLAAVLGATLADHARATLLALHGWNVVQPVVDLGLGCGPGPDPFTVGTASAVAQEFAATALPALVAACAARGIGATVGARYPARNRENLIQLFTARYRDDPRPAVRALAAHASRVDAVQLELGIPLRWPGAWRTRFVAAVREALPALIGAASSASAAPAVPAPSPIQPGRLQFTAPTFCGLVAIDRDRGGRLLLFPPEGGLVLFTGERIGLESPGTVSRLTMQAAPDGARAVAHRGPLLRFPDTTPFLDLEAGLARAELVEADVDLVFTPDHPGCAPSGFGRVRGTVLLDGVRHAIEGDGFAEDGGGAAGPWPRLRTAMRLVGGAGLALTVGLDGADASGFLCRGGEHVPVATARATFADETAALARVTLELELDDGERLRVVARTIHRLPVIRARTPAARIEFAACRVEGDAAARAWPAGWVEAVGP